MTVETRHWKYLRAACKDDKSIIHYITCNNRSIVELTPVKDISTQSRFSPANSLPCENGYQPLTHQFRQFCLVWGYWSWLGGHTYFVNQVWLQPAIWVWKSCISTVNILLNLEFFHIQSATFLPHCITREAFGPLHLRCLPHESPNSIFFDPEQYISLSDGENH